MRVPVKIPVAGKVVTILYIDRVPGETEDEDAYGDTTSDGKTIRISKTKHHSEREVFETLYHEWLHSSLTLTGLSHMLGDKLEEAVVTGLENAIGDLLCFNPESRVKWREIPFPFEE